MTRYDVIPMQVDHLGGFVPQPYQKDNIEALRSLDWIKYKDHGFALTCIWHEKPIAIGGVIEQYPGVGEAWSIISQEVGGRELRYVFSSIRCVIDSILKTSYHRIYCNVRTDFGPGMRMARMLGMELEGVMRSFPQEDIDSALFARTR